MKLYNFDTSFVVIMFQRRCMKNSFRWFHSNCNDVNESYSVQQHVFVWCLWRLITNCLGTPTIIFIHVPSIYNTNFNVVSVVIFIHFSRGSRVLRFTRFALKSPENLVSTMDASYFSLASKSFSICHLC